jgi:hypothetical protein
MRRFALLSFVIAFAACDPSLDIKTVPGTPEGGTSEGGTPPAPPPAPGDGGADDAGDAATADDAGDAGTVHVIDGVNDFAAGDKLATTSSGSGYYAYVSWDTDKVYFGMTGADVGSGSSSKWVLIYVDGNPGNAGTTTGISYDCSGTCTAQQPTLPFSAGYHLRWKADGSYTNLQKWSGSAWANVGPISTVAKSGTFMEMSITRAALGSPTRLKVSMNMLIEQSGAEWTYAGVPSTSFTDGKDATPFNKYFDFDLSDVTTAPNTYAPKP